MQYLFAKINMVSVRRVFISALIITILCVAVLPLGTQALGGDAPASSAPPSGNFLTKLITGSAMSMVNDMTYLLVGASAYIVGLAAGLLDYAINISFSPFKDLQILITVWRFFSDFANVLFIFIILMIAIATILRLESYGIKRLLPTLIIVALTINFSLLITQYIIYPANWVSEDL
ncbi:MAG: hypothetical protein AAB930_01770, partial [Patescibacteria group bacterium]